MYKALYLSYVRRVLPTWRAKPVQLAVGIAHYRITVPIISRRGGSRQLEMKPIAAHLLQDHQLKLLVHSNCRHANFKQSLLHAEEKAAHWRKCVADHHLPAAVVARVSCNS